MVSLLGLILLVPWCVTRGGGDAATDEEIAEVTPATCASATADLPLRARLAMTLMVGVDGDAPADAVALLDGATRPGRAVRAGRVGDLGRRSPWPSRRGDDLPLLVAVDDEGGSVQPMEGVLDELPSAADARRGVARGR